MDHGAAEFADEGREVGLALRAETVVDQMEDDIPLSGRGQTDRPRNRKGRRPEAVVEGEDDVDF
jgi:hypothetical protein